MWYHKYKYKVAGDIKNQFADFVRQIDKSKFTFFPLRDIVNNGLKVFSCKD